MSAPESEDDDFDDDGDARMGENSSVLVSTLYDPRDSSRAEKTLEISGTMEKDIKTMASGK